MIENADLPEKMIIYDGNGNPPQIERHRSVLLLPNSLHAQRWYLDRTITYRYHYLEGHVQLTLKLQAIAASHVIISNQLNEAVDRQFSYVGAVIEGVYLQLLLGKYISNPYLGVRVILLDIQEDWSNYLRVKIATIATLRKAIMGES